MANGSYFRGDQGHESNISLSAPNENDKESVSALTQCSYILSDTGTGASAIAAKASANTWGSKLDAALLKKSLVPCLTTSSEIDETMKLFI